MSKTIRKSMPDAKDVDWREVKTDVFSFLGRHPVENAPIVEGDHTGYLMLNAVVDRKSVTCQMLPGGARCGKTLHSCAVATISSGMANWIRSIKKRLMRHGHRQRNHGHEAPVHVDKQTRLSDASFVGRYSYVGRGVVYGDVRIGRYCSIAHDFSFIGSNHSLSLLTTHPFPCSNELFGDVPEYRDVEFKKRMPAQDAGEPPLVIGHDVWIGSRVVILGKARSIGNGAVIGAGSVVTRDVPPYAIVAGNPARTLRYRFDEATIGELEKLQWWDLPLTEIKHLDFADIDACVSELKRLRAARED